MTRDGEPRRTLPRAGLLALAALLLGGGGAFGLFTMLDTPEEPRVAAPSTRQPLLWCLGHRSKADRIAYWKQRTGIDPDALPTPRGPVTVTYSKDIAPILYNNCATCHRPGEITPFSVLSYKDVKPWAWVIGVVTQNRYMPPWPPGRESDVAFEGERRLSDADIALIQRWVSEGAAEGDAADLPPPPAFSDEWQLGKPDLVVRLPQPFVLPADGTEVYRNLVLPVPVKTNHWVSAVEIRPGNKKFVHHGIMQVDRLQAGRRLDAEDAEVGFGGMDMGPTENPGGHLIGWSPGKVPLVAPDGMAWRVGPGTDFILQLHMLPSGKPEKIAPEVALYFTDKPAAKHPFGLVLRNNDIDIPAGDDHYEVRESLVLPVDVQVLGIYPHAHYLGKRIESTAKLPDGTTRTLLDIKDWDFGWQDEYRYKEPVSLPAGTELSMRFVFDNSAANPRNPSSPPHRVVAGNHSTDEMAIIVYQVLPKNHADELSLREAIMRDRLEEHPNAWYPHNMLAITLRAEGKIDEAIYHLREAMRLNPTYTRLIFNLGNAYQSKGDLDRAIRYYEEMLQLEPDHAKAHNNLAIALASQGKFAAAVEHYEAQLELSPDNAGVHFNLATALLALRRYDSAERHLRRALALDSEVKGARIALADTLRALGKSRESLARYREALGKDPDSVAAHLGAGLSELDLGRPSEALAELDNALRIDGNAVTRINDAAWALATAADADKRSPPNAVVLAEYVDARTGHAIPEVMDTLAAAYAADGQFSRAAETLTEALARAQDEALASQFQERLALYESNRPYVSAGALAN